MSLPNTRFNGGAENAAGGDTHSISRSVPSAGGFGAGTMRFGDLIVLQAVGDSSTAGQTVPVVSDDVTGATGWALISDSGAYSPTFRSTWWWKRCVGAESSVSADWGGACGRGIIAAFVRDPGLLDEAYLIGEGGATFNPPNVTIGPFNPSGDHQMYLGGTAMGPQNYSFASIRNPPGTYDLNGVGGDGFNSGASDGVSGIIHINTNVPANLATDSLTYESQPIGFDVWDAFVGLRVSCPQTERVDLFGNWHYGGGAPDGVQVSVSFPVAAAGDPIVVMAGGIDGDWNTSQPVITDDAGSTGWAVDSDFVYGVAPNEFRVTVYRKTAVGGETSLTVAWAGSTNKTLIGAVVRGLPAGATPYIIDAGLGPYVGGVANIFRAGAGTVTGDGQVYVGLTCEGRISPGVPVTDYIEPPRGTDSTGMVQASSGGLSSWAFAFADTCENVAADRPEISTTGPNLPFFVLYYGFSTGDVLASTAGGTFLGSAAATIENFDIHAASAGGVLEGSAAATIAGAVHGASAGGLLEGRATPTIEGGQIPAESSGGLAQGRSFGRVAPGVVRVPEDHLGCGVYQCFAFTRGLREIVTTLPFSTVEWDRVLDDTSTATLTIDGVSNPRALARCCAALSELEPAEHELAVYRNGWRVWSGPITDMTFPAEQAVIQASDLSWWLSERTIHENINSVQVDLANILVAYVSDAMSVENSAGLYATILALSGQLGDRLVQQADHQLAYDVVGELARSGVDWTTLDRRMLVGPLLPQPPPFPGATPYPTLIDSNFRIQPTILVSSSQQGNAWYVNGPPNGAGDLIFGEYGPHFPATPDHVEVPAAPDYAAIEAQYGRLEKIVTESRILDQPGIDFNARTRYDLLKRAVVSISDGSLLPSSPIPMEKLLAGSIVNVHLSNVCRVIAEPYRIKAVKVRGSSDGSETVDVQWQPLGTGETL